MATMKKYAMGGPIPTAANKTTKKPKVVTKKPKSVSERIGDLTFRDVKNAGEDALQLATLGGYGQIKKALGGEYKYKKIKKNKDGGKVSKAKNGKSFPDLNKDGKITKADILKGRGVIAKKGMTVKKAQDGAKTADSTSYFRGRAKDMARKSLYAEGKGDKKLSDVYMDVASKSSSDASRQANKGKKGYDANGFPKKKAKTGASVKKCKYGCN